MASAWQSLTARLAERRSWLVRQLIERRPSESRHIFGLTLVIGVACGLVAVAFHLSLRFAERELIGRALSLSGWRGALVTLFMPALGGLVAGILLEYVVPRARGSGIPQVKEVYGLEGGRIRFRDAAGKFLISVLQIGTGASLGREGPTVHICAGVASLAGRATFLPAKSVRRLIPVGAAAGIAAAFNAPIAAVTFTIEEIVGNLDQTVLSGVVIAAALAAVIERSVLGAHPVFEVPQPYGLDHTSSLLVYAALGLAAGGVSILFSDSLLLLRARFQRTRRIPGAARPALGGLVAGALAIPAVHFLHSNGIFGGGYETLAEALSGQLPLRALMLLGVLKLGATVFSYSSGGAGGIFAPTLFVGAMLGGAFGYLDAAALGHPTDQLGAFALVGMGAVFAGVIRAPITSVLIIFELTGGYGLILPLMIANMTAYVLARHWRPLPIYDALLAQDGIRLPHQAGAPVHRLERLAVESAMTQNPITLPGAASVADALDIVQAHGFSAFPVVSAERVLLGMMSAEQLRKLASEGRDQIRLDGVVERGLSIRQGAPLVHAVVKMGHAGARQLPIVSEGAEKLVGILSMSDVFRVHAAAMGDEGAGSGVAPDRPLLRGVNAEKLLRKAATVPSKTHLSSLMQRLLAAEDGVLAVVDDQGGLQGLVSLEEIKDIWNEQSLDGLVVAAEVVRPVRHIGPKVAIEVALDIMEEERTDALPVVDAGRVVGVLTREAVGRFLFEKYREVEGR